MIDRQTPESASVIHLPAERSEHNVDHVWANVRAFLPGGGLHDACQLGGDRLGPHLAELATSATVVGPKVAPGPTWSAVGAAAHAVPLPDDSFDVVAIDDLSAAGRRAARVLDEAIRLCRPTGTVVVGFRSFRLRRGARRALRNRSDRLAVTIPGPRRPAFIVAPDDGDAARYFVRHMAFAYRPPGTSGFRARILALRSRVAMAVPASLALRGAPGRIAAVQAAEAPASILRRLQELVRSSWSDLGMDGPAPDRLQPLIVGHRRPKTGVVTVLLFPPRRRTPVVAKFPRYGGTNPSLQREDAALQHVSESITAPLRPTIPRSLGVITLDGIDVGLQTGVAGHHLVAQTASKRLRPERVAKQLDVVLSWCLELQRASAHERIVDEAFITSRLATLAAAAVTALNGDERTAELLDRTMEQARGLIGTSLPMVVAHGDYWAGNIMIDRGRVIGVVDWERATTDDMPFWDPVKAVGSAAYHLDRYRAIPRRGRGGLPLWGDLGPWKDIAEPQFAVGFRAAFVQPGWLADTSREALVRMFTEAGIPLAWLPVAITFYLVRQIVQAGDSPRAIAGWGSVLRALATSPGTWADEFGHGTAPSDRWAHVRPPADATSVKWL